MEKGFVYVCGKKCFYNYVYRYFDEVYYLHIDFKKRGLFSDYLLCKCFPFECIINKFHRYNFELKGKYENTYYYLITRKI